MKRVFIGFLPDTMCAKFYKAESIIWLLRQTGIRTRLFPVGLEAGYHTAYAATYGGHYKVEARAFAAARGFHGVATKKDSIGVCFCPRDYRSFLRREAGAQKLPNKGKFIDENGCF